MYCTCRMNLKGEGVHVKVIEFTENFNDFSIKVTITIN